MTSIVEKLKKYLEYKGIAVSVAERDLGLSNGALSKPFNAGTNIKTDTLEKFLNNYNDINPKWLIGNDKIMLLKNKNLLIEDETGFFPSKDDYIIKLQRDKIIELEKKVEKLKKEIEAFNDYRLVSEPNPKLKKNK